MTDDIDHYKEEYEKEFKPKDESNKQGIKKSLLDECEHVGSVLCLDCVNYGNRTILAMKDYIKITEVGKIIFEDCGQVSGNAVRNNVNSLGSEFYINVLELEGRIEEFKKRIREGK